jgi:hypothetical protein
MSNLTIQSLVRHPTDVWYSSYNATTDTTTQYFTPGYYPTTNSRTTGLNIPDWRRLIAEGEDATTYLSGSRYSSRQRRFGELFIEPGPNWTAAYNWRFGHLENVPFVTSFAGMDALESTADNKAKTLFLKKLKKTQTKFQSGVFLGEIHETLEFIRNPALGLRRGINEYYTDVKKRLKGAKRGLSRRYHSRNLSEIVADTWLEHAFAWSPLVNDVKDGAEALANYNLGKAGEARRITAKAGAEDTQYTPFYSRNFGYLKYHYRYQTKASVVVIYRAGVGASPDSPLLMSAKHFGVSWEEIIPTIWELIPYSFLVDYFTNIGDILDSWSYQHLKKRWMNRTVLRTIEHSMHDMYLDQAILTARKNAGLVMGASLVPYQQTRRYRTVLRERLDADASLIPDLSFELPGLGSRSLNIAALARMKTL